MIIKIIVPALFLLAANNTYAQSTYWDKAEAKYNSDHRERIRTNANTKSNTNNSSSNGNGTTQTKATSAKEAQEYIEYRKVVEYEAREREAQRIRDHNDYLQRITDDNATAKRNFIQNNIDAFKGNKNYTHLDIKIFAEQDFYLINNDRDEAKMETEKYLSAVRFINKLVLAKPDTPIDTLVNYIWGARYFPDYSIAYLKKLQSQFPAEKSYLERNELRIITYYFGATRTYVTSAIGYTYPLCGFEIMEDDQKIKILDRFEELEAIYPETALKAAGECRVGFNIFYKYATSNLKLKNKSDEKRLDYLYKALATVQPDRVLPARGFTDQIWKILADTYLKGIAVELKLMYPDFVQNLSSENWLEISDAYKINVEYIAWAFRDDNNHKAFLKKYPNLVNARKQEFKKEEDGNGEITFENRDKYKGEIKNGKPNGEGKLTTATGNIFEGNFKNGYLHGKGKAYYYKDVMFTNGKNSAGFKFFANDIYEGDYDNGLREGKGTLYNKERGSKYVGDWKNDKRDGEGEESSIDVHLKTTATYKGGFKEGKKEGDGINTDYYGNIYTGNFKDGTFDGKGTMKYADGSTLEGKWDAGYVDGKAKLTSAKGYVMQYENEIKKSFYKKQVYERSFSEKNKKYFNPDGKEITEQEYNTNK